MLERDLEKIFVREIKAAGGAAYKFASPGNGGVPDRIVLLPRGRIVFVELKTSTGRLTRLQKIQCDRIAAMGQSVRVLCGLEEVWGFFREFGLNEAAGKIARRIYGGAK